MGKFADALEKLADQIVKENAMSERADDKHRQQLVRELSQAAAVRVEHPSDAGENLTLSDEDISVIVQALSAPSATLPSTDRNAVLEEARLAYDSHVFFSSNGTSESDDVCRRCGSNIRNALHLRNDETREGRIAALKSVQCEVGTTINAAGGSGGQQSGRTDSQESPAGEHCHPAAPTSKTPRIVDIGTLESAQAECAYLLGENQRLERELAEANLVLGHSRADEAPRPSVGACDCTSYNGGPCYNCINGAHNICNDGKRVCPAARSSTLPPTAHDAVLEKAARACEDRNRDRHGYVSRKREEARACAADIRALKNVPADEGTKKP